MSDSDQRDYIPRHCVWELTLACNLRCGHCGSRAGKPRPDELTTRECVDLTNQLADLGCRLITLSGGEPTLRPSWEAVVRTAVFRGVTVNMVTNGTTMTPDLAQQIAQSGLSNVGISLDGTRRNHERVRGRGTFRRVVTAMHLLRETGMRYSLLTHLNRDTARELEEVHALAVNLGAAVWRVQLGKPMGNLADHRDQCIRPEDLLDVIPRLATIKESSPIEVHVGDSIGYYGPHEKLLRHTRWGNMQPLWAGCQAGMRSVGIESDGGIKGCLSLQAGRHQAGGDPFREGDIRSRSLAEIWFDPQAFAYNRHQSVDDLTGACQTCRWAARCRGGAKCVSSAFTGGISEDPYCYHRVGQEADARRQRERACHASSGLRQSATAALLGLGLGLGTACLGGCLERAVGTSSDATVTRSDAEPPSGEDYGFLPDPVDAGLPDAFVQLDAEPPNTLDYGVFPEFDAAVFDPDAEPPNNGDYGVYPELDAGIVDPDAEPPNHDDYGDIPPWP